MPRKPSPYEQDFSFVLPVFQQLLHPVILTSRRLAVSVARGKLRGRKKKSNYYYAFAPKNGDITAMLGKRLLENFICYGESTEKRKLAPKGGAGNTTYDKVFDAIWDNTIGKL